ncbi:hypothetical protein C2845_PM18G01580 [Panicum miliaceum]|uniref:Uncharacterized protein n=1 Tax=Panicum miliaceum TaxID=4540 RepID=A0A3L6PP38_PANMI|nr:hypothetical protein C2845_PM18G01580 [Panicum miliaceum]
MPSLHPAHQRRRAWRRRCGTKGEAVAIGDEIADAIDYVDAGTLDAFQFIGALPLLVELGVQGRAPVADAQQAVDKGAKRVDAAGPAGAAGEKRTADADRQWWRQLWASMHVRTASCASKRERMWWRTLSGRSLMRGLLGAV